jgi:hypothetical protein
MSDRRNRRILAFVGLILVAAGALAICLSSQVFGVTRSKRDVFDNTVIRWWNQGGWISFAVAVAVGVLLAVVGWGLIRGQLRRNDGRERTPTIGFRPTEGERGATVLRSPALSHTMEDDLTAIPDVLGARVGLFGSFPHVEMRAVIDISDDADLGKLPARVDEVLQRMQATTGVRPDPVQITVRFKGVDTERQIA